MSFLLIHTGLQIVKLLLFKKTYRLPLLILPMILLTSEQITGKNAQTDIVLCRYEY